MSPACRGTRFPPRRDAEGSARRRHDGCLCRASSTCAARGHRRQLRDRRRCHRRSGRCSSTVAPRHDTGGRRRRVSTQRSMASAARRSRRSSTFRVMAPHPAIRTSASRRRACPRTHWAASDALPFRAGITPVPTSHVRPPVLHRCRRDARLAVHGVASHRARGARVHRRQHDRRPGHAAGIGHPGLRGPGRQRRGRLRGGNDMVLTIMFSKAGTAPRIVDGIVAAVDSGDVPLERLDEAAAPGHRTSARARSVGPRAPAVRRTALPSADVSRRIDSEEPCPDRLAALANPRCRRTYSAFPPGSRWATGCSPRPASHTAKPACRACGCPARARTRRGSGLPAPAGRA